MNRHPIHKLVISNLECKTQIEFLEWLAAGKDSVDLARKNAILTAKKELSKKGLEVLPLAFYIKEDYPEYSNFSCTYDYYVEVDWDKTLKDFRGSDE